MTRELTDEEQKAVTLLSLAFQALAKAKMTLNKDGSLTTHDNLTLIEAEDN